MPRSSACVVPGEGSLAADRPAVPSRRVSAAERRSCQPVYCVWEVTLACDQRCLHCGSRAGKRRPDELSTAACEEAIAQLAALGVREVTLMGGEAYLRNDWLRLIAALRDAGIAPTLLTGGRGLSPDELAKAQRAGLVHLGLSIEGLADVHDAIHGVAGSFDSALQVLRRARELDLPTTVNTNLSPKAVAGLPALLDQLAGVGVASWRMGMVIPSGRAAAHPELLIQPHALVALMPQLADLYLAGLEHALVVQWDDGMGYFGPYEHLLRSGREQATWWQGCHAGINGLGLQSDGTAKPCTSLPASYAAGTVTGESLESLWRQSPAMAFARDSSVDELWGFCGSCYYAALCRAGCTWTSHALFGKRGNNPYCHHRALELARQGVRERLVVLRGGAGEPYDHGELALEVEALDGGAPPAGWAPIDGTASRARDRGGQLPEAHSPLVLCHGCSRHVLSGTARCPHCDTDVDEARRHYEESYAEAMAAHDELTAALCELCELAEPVGGGDG
ncbi:MAG: radical SAM protein [Deltaproteobacteria bacterium]|nr:radical SAM protein [Deltaproteobacteria bacterium]